MDRKKIKNRLMRLLAMTVENGATEAEALAAAEKAAKLMSEHNLSYRTVEEIEAEAYSDNRRDWFRGAKGRRRSAPVPHTRWCLEAIDDLCGTEHTYNTYTGKLAFFGAEHDTQAAHYLERIISNAMLREWSDYNGTKHASARTSFMKAMAIRVAVRLGEMKPKTEAASTGTDLIALKNALLANRFAAAHPRVKGQSPSPVVRDRDAALAGDDAGRRVALNQGLNEAQGARAIAGS